ncbi:DUF5076 domain-containing protein [Sphingomonas sp. LHG3443-2]|uniref:DUF5076 domain-containing protein n=1 Tax=Sphingomonas sp. LHG3443-2 TaxID=2804639 RepID=UPI003CEED078
MTELGIPPAATRDPRAFEMMRVWIAEHRLHCAMNIGVYEAQGIAEERAWGIILADAAQHLADALSSEGLRERKDVLRDIRTHFQAELDDPTSRTCGSFRD